MKNSNKKTLYSGLLVLTAFVLWTILVCIIDVDAVGPNGSQVGFSKVNVFIHNITGVNMSLYTITDWLGLVPIIITLGFAVLGALQWIRRKKLKLVDYNIFVLAGFYVMVVAIYVFFEMASINYRPVLINDCLEKSYPSSTTMLVLTIMPTTIMQIKSRFKNLKLKNGLVIVSVIFIIFMVFGRLISGVHWFTDIVGGVLLSAGLVKLYCFVINLK